MGKGSLYILGNQKNPSHWVLSSTHSIYFGWEIKMYFFIYALLSGGLGRKLH